MLIYVLYTFNVDIIEDSKQLTPHQDVKLTLIK